MAAAPLGAGARRGRVGGEALARRLEAHLRARRVDAILDAGSLHVVEPVTQLVEDGRLVGPSLRLHAAGRDQLRRGTRGGAGGGWMGWGACGGCGGREAGACMRVCSYKGLWHTCMRRPVDLCMRMRRARSRSSACTCDIAQHSIA